VLASAANDPSVFVMIQAVVVAGDAAAVIYALGNYR